MPKQMPLFKVNFSSMEEFFVWKGETRDCETKLALPMRPKA